MATVQNSAPASRGPPLAGKYVVVTGGTKGIGLATAVRLASMGAKGVAVTFNHDHEAAETAKAKIEEHGVQVAIIQADIISEQCGSYVIKSTLKALNIDHLDIIINNAAIAPHLPMSDITLENFQEAFTANAFTPMAIARAAMPYLPESGGRIINVSTVLAKDPFGDEQRMVLAASKAALESITRSMAITFAARKKATFNSVSVGPTETKFMQEIMSTMPQGIKQGLLRQHTAEHRFGQGEDIAMAIGFWASDFSRWINGASIRANGGLMIVVFG